MDDGSTDSTPERLGDLAASDSRVRVLRREASGLTDALIAGCEAARGTLIARQDCGDRSLPGRLAGRPPRSAGSRRLSWCRARRSARRREARSSTCARARLRADRSRSPGPVRRRVAAAARPPTARRCSAAPTISASAGIAARSAWPRTGTSGCGSASWAPTSRFRRRCTSNASAPIRCRSGGFRSSAGTAKSPQRRPEHGRSREVTRSSSPRRPSSPNSFEQALSSSSLRRARALAAYHFGTVLLRRSDSRSRSYLRRAVSADPLLGRAWIRLAQSCLVRGRAQ